MKLFMTSCIVSTEEDCLSVGEFGVYVNFEPSKIILSMLSLESLAGFAEASQLWMLAIAPK